MVKVNFITQNNPYLIFMTIIKTYCDIWLMFGCDAMRYAGSDVTLQWPCLIRLRCVKSGKR